MSVHTSQVTISTSQTLLVPTTQRRLSYVVSVPSTSSTIYITNNSGTTSGTGTPIVANGTFRMNWFDDGTGSMFMPDEIVEEQYDPKGLNKKKGI